MMWLIRTYDVCDIRKKLKTEVITTSELDMTMSAGNNVIRMTLDRGKMLRDMVRIDKAIEERFPGQGLIEEIKWKERR